MIFYKGRLKTISYHIMKKQLFILSLLLAATLLSLMLGLAWGSKPLTLADVWQYFTRPGQSYADLVIAHRIPRTLAAWLCGGALGLAGALMQGLTRNPLGDSGLLGINTGAAAAIVLTAFFPAAAAVSSYWPAIGGALLTALLVCLLGLTGRAENHSRLILAGASVSACLGAFVNAVSQVNIRTFDFLRFWASGSFGGVGFADLTKFLPFFIPAALLGLALGKFVNIIALDKHVARSLGANVVAIQSLVLIAVAVLSAASVALAGPIGFVGLAAAHLSRRWTGNDYRFLLPAGLLSGGSLLLLADILARLVLAPDEIATGIMTALLGAPILYIMVMRGAKGQS
ncbi:FecCD family ABC transporter permease [Neisseria chenwenguii]|uniref:Iron ABC transporter permease n=1 Tax=Neisseria chenwenguii TaxID=1853278 RepID=A0A220S3N9_9NEIS|nr:iron ABC transporter permease [Neisseria chenwenguii]ASK28090.1 iron ABC transporter permease [Neisseria chenwenguii]ROV57241.1 iron ABC transporter permease [Neisseria chenwenguii]